MVVDQQQAIGGGHALEKRLSLESDVEHQDFLTPEVLHVRRVDVIGRQVGHAVAPFLVAGPGGPKPIGAVLVIHHQGGFKIKLHGLHSWAERL